MAFANKIDYCDLVAATTASGGTAVLTLRDDTENASAEKYQPQGSDGSIIATEVYGQDSAPQNNYGLAATLTTQATTLKLGKIKTIDSKKYALEKISISTGAGQVAKISATCQEVEAGATDATANHYSVPAFTVSTQQKAQNIFDAFSIVGSGCHLTECNAEISCTVSKDKVAGTKIASDINSGMVVVTGTILQSGSTAPTITAEDGWTVTQAPNCTNPETAYKSYSFEIVKHLAKDS